MRIRCLPAATAVALCALFCAAATARGDDTAARIRGLTDAFAAASDRQDQAAMDALLDPDILFSGGSGQVDRDAERDRNDAVSELLRSQTQAFRDGWQRGDIARMRVHLDDALTLVDEDGGVATKASLRKDSSSIAPGCEFTKLVLGDWVVHHDADVAASSYTVIRTFDCAGKAVDTRSLAVDIWRQRARHWTLVGSQTIALHQDPAALGVKPDVLAAYAGDYSDGAGLTVRISVEGNALAATVNGDKPYLLIPESPDVFYRPVAASGYARRHVCFRRDPGGHIAEYATNGLILHRRDAPEAAGASTVPLPEIASSLTLRDFQLRRAGNIAVATFLHDRVANFHGHAIHATYRSMEAWVKRGLDWKMISSQGRELQADLPAAKVPPKPLADYVGSYALTPARIARVSLDGGHLVAALGPHDVFALTPVAEDRFLVPGRPRMSLIFQRNPLGCVTALLDRRDETDVRLTRLQVKGDSLLAADRALAARSAEIGFVPAYANAMAPDARKLDGGVPTAQGREAILALMARYPADLELDWSPEEAVVAGSTDMGYTWGHFVARHHDEKGALVTEFGRYLDVWHRDRDGLWRWIADIGTSDPKGEDPTHEDR